MESHPLLNRCVSVENCEMGRSLMAMSNHRIYRKELLSDWKPAGYSKAKLDKGSFVAMKQFCGRACKRGMKELCEKEFNMLVSCNHDNVVTVLELCLEIEENNPESWPYFLMELGECSLEFALRAKLSATEDNNEFAYPTGDHGYSWPHCIIWLRQIASAMSYLHDKNIIHRDLKTSNVLLFDSKRICKVCDFDMSRVCDPEGMTVDIGTWRWMAPEVRNRGTGSTKQDYDVKADCYSFGILICECLFRQRPFDTYEDRIFFQLEIPNTPIMEESDSDAAKQPAMTLQREGEENSRAVRVVLNKSCAVFDQPSGRMWKLTEGLLAWNPEDRSTMDIVVSRLAIEKPTIQKADDGGEGMEKPPPLAPTELEYPPELKTDTGLLPRQVCPAVPSVPPVLNVTLLYTTQLADGGGSLTVEEKERIVDVLKTHSDNVVSFLEEEESEVAQLADGGESAGTARQAADSDHVPPVTCPVSSHFRFTDNDCLEHVISGADQATRQRVADACCCRGADGKFLTWLAGLFSRETRQRRLRGVQFHRAGEGATTAAA